MYMGKELVYVESLFLGQKLKLENKLNLEKDTLTYIDSFIDRED